MGGGSVTVAALRHRPRQALLVVTLAAVVTGAAVIGPLYARAVEQSVLRTVVSSAAAAERGVGVTATATSGSRPAEPARLAGAVRVGVPAAFLPPVQGGAVPVLVGPVGSATHRARLASRDGLCRHVELADGRCPRAAGEVLVSRRTAGSTGLRSGSSVRVVPEAAVVAGSPPVELTAEVVGVYEAFPPDDPFWSGRTRTAAPTNRPGDGPDELSAVDDVLTTWETLAAAPWPQLQTHVDIALAPDRVDLDGIDEIAAAVPAIERRAATVDAAVTSGLGPLLASTRAQRDQAQTVVPLLTGQLAVLGIIVLTFVCAAATEQRRPEIALARLRGLGTIGAATLLLRELGLLVLTGAAVGAGLGWAAAGAATRLWLEPGVVLELRPPVALAVVAAALAGLLAIVAAGAPTLRQPLTSLLRQVPPRTTSLQVGLVEGAVAASAAAGVVTLLAGEGGPVALLAPGLLALAGGLLLSQLVIPAAGPLGRLSLRHGHVSWALAALQVARRPSLRRLIAIVTVACALLVFAVDAWTVAGRNRTTRAGVEAGAPVVLTVDAASSLALRRAVLDIDPDGRFATPVVTIRSVTDAGPRTTAVEPGAFTRIARWGTDQARPSASLLTGLAPARATPVELRGTRVEVTADVASRALPLPDPEADLPTLKPLGLTLTVEDGSGVLRQVDLGQVRAGPKAYTGALPCPEGCRLRNLTVSRTFGDFAGALVTVEVSAVRAGPAAGELVPADLDTGRTGAWVPVPWQPGALVTGAVGVRPTLSITDASYGEPVAVQRGDVPVNPPGLTTGAVPEAPTDPNRKERLVLSAGLGAGEVAYHAVGALPRVPRTGPRGVLVALSTVVTGPSGSPAQTTYDVWLAAQDPARERRLRDELTERGISVVGRDSEAEHSAELAAQGPALALRLAVVAGLVSVVLAASVLVVGVATSGTGRARDLAGLRLVGVPAATVRGAAVREHLVVATLGVLAGSVLGVVAARLALPLIPLFATPAVRLPLVLGPVWPMVLVTVAGCLLLLSTVSVMVGRTLAATATPARLREGQ